jgi:putative acetyltransferase
MPETPVIKRTEARDKDFQLLIKQLDHELWNELKEDQATYDPFNIVLDVQTAILIYVNDEPVACGCFKEHDDETVEIKRMFVQKTHRGKGLSKKLLQELEGWALEKNYKAAVLETSIRFTVARNLYQTNGYKVVSNYPPYVGLAESVCMKKELRPAHG